MHKQRSLRSQRPALTGGGGVASSPKAGGAASASFLGPTPLFPISPRSWGGGHCLPQARTSASGSAGDMYMSGCGAVPDLWPGILP